VLVILLGRGYDVRCYDDLKWHDTYMPSFMIIGSNI
jgi:hypothetical protein